MAKRLNPNKEARTLPDGKRVRVSSGQARISRRRAPLKTTRIRS